MLFRHCRLKEKGKSPSYPHVQTQTHTAHNKKKDTSLIGWKIPQRTPKMNGSCIAFPLLIRKGDRKTEVGRQRQADRGRGLNPDFSFTDIFFILLRVISF